MDPQLIVGRLTYVLWLGFCLAIAGLLARGSHGPTEGRGPLSVDEWLCVGMLFGLPLAVLVYFVEADPRL